MNISEIEYDFSMNEMLTLFLRDNISRSYYSVIKENKLTGYFLKNCAPSTI